MNKKERLMQLERETKEFEYQRLKKQELFQQVQNNFQTEIAQINQGILTRQGGIIELKRLIAEEEQETHEPNTS